MSSSILEGKKLSKSYFIGEKELKAVRGIDISLKKGETLGLVGESGCGKSTVLKMLTRLEEPTSGRLYFKEKDITDQKGKELRQNRKHIQMVFQDPSSAFSPRMRVREALEEPLKNFYDFTKVKREEKIKELLGLVQLSSDFIERYCHEMSGGQRQRLGIARALAAEPDILVCDEATSALDVSIQDNIMKLLAEIQRKRNLSIVFVCHDISLVASISHKIMVMYLGDVIEELESALFVSKACHPYSKLLQSSIFSVTMDFTKEIRKLEGDVPNPLDVISGCPFRTRCSQAIDICKSLKPELKTIGENHKVACHLI